MKSFVDGIPADDRRAKLVDELTARSTSPIAAIFSPAHLVALHGEFPAEAADPEAAARSFLERWARLFGFSAAETRPATIAKSGPDGRGRVVRFEFPLGRLPWFQGGVEVSFDAKHRIRSVFARLPTVEPRLPGNVDPSRAIEAIQAQFPDERDRDRTFKPRLVIFDPSSIGMPGNPQPMFEFTAMNGQGPPLVLVSPDGGTIIPVGARPEGIPFNTPLPRYRLNPTTRVPDFVSFAPTGLLLPEASTGDPTAVAFALFHRYPTLFGTGAPAAQLQVVEIITADFLKKPVTTVVLRQMYDGVPVYGCQLRVHLSPALAIRSISGVYYRDPEVTPIPRLTALQAHQAAFGAWTANGGIEQPGLPGPGSGELVILPARLTRSGGPRNHLAWHFMFPDQHLFISAETGSLVFILSRYEGDARVFDANGKKKEQRTQGAVLQFVDGVAQTGALDPEAQQTADSIQAVLAFWQLFGRTGWDGRDSPLAAYVDVDFTNNAKAIGGELILGRGMAVPDVIAHELTHCLIRSSSNLTYVDEPGAANESYADVFGNLVFPDTPAADWIQNSGTGPKVPKRNLREPSKSTPDPQPETYSRYNLISEDAGGLHTNSGILNRAAVLLADGDAALGHAGIGRSRLATLYYFTLVHNLHPWAMFIDVLIRTHDSAQFLADHGEAGAALPALNGVAPPLFAKDTADEVLWAFAQVGLNMQLTTGWFNLPGQAVFEQVLFEGVNLSAGETVRDVRVWGRQFSGKDLLATLTVAATGPTKDTAGTRFVLSIDSGQIGTSSPQSTLHFESPNFIQLTTEAIYEVKPAPAPPGQPPPPPPPPVTLRDTSLFVNFCDMPFCGRRYRDDIYINESLPAGCTVLDVELTLFGVSGPARRTTRFGLPGAHGGGFGASIVLVTRGGQGLHVVVNSWHDAGSIVCYGLRYFIQGNACELPPLTRIWSTR